MSKNGWHWRNQVVVFPALVIVLDNSSAFSIGAHIYWLHMERNGIDWQWNEITENELVHGLHCIVIYYLMDKFNRKYLHFVELLKWRRVISWVVGLSITSLEHTTYGKNSSNYRKARRVKKDRHEMNEREKNSIEIYFNPQNGTWKISTDRWIN